MSEEEKKDVIHIDGSEENCGEKKASKCEYLKKNWKPMGQGFLFGTVFGTIVGSVGTAVHLSKFDDIDEDDSEDSDESDDSED